MNSRELIEALDALKGQAEAVVSMCEDACQTDYVSVVSREALTAASSNEAESMVREIKSLCERIQDAGIKHETSVELVHDEVSIGGNKIIQATRDGGDIDVTVLLRFATPHLAADACAEINKAVHGEGPHLRVSE